MTIDSLIQQIEAYFGKYDTNLKKFVVKYLESDYKQKDYADLLKSILYFHKANFSAPCIASIEDCVKKARAEKNLNKHEKKETKSKLSEYRKEFEDNPNDFVSRGELKEFLKDLAQNKQ